MGYTSIEGWAAWHPEHGFCDPYDFDQTPIAWIELDGAVRRVRSLNADAGTNNRNGWRAVKITIARHP